MVTRTNGPRSNFERRHYVRIADVIRRTRELPHDSCAEVWGDLIETLCDDFARDNPNFQRGTFKRACGSVMQHGGNIVVPQIERGDR